MMAAAWLSFVCGSVELDPGDDAPTHVQVVGERTAIRIPTAGDHDNFVCGGYCSGSSYPRLQISWDMH